MRRLVLLSILPLLSTCGPPDVTEPQPERDISTLGTTLDQTVSIQVSGHMRFTDPAYRKGYAAVTFRVSAPAAGVCKLDERCAVGSVLAQEPSGTVRYDALRMTVDQVARGTGTRLQAVIHVQRDDGEHGPDYFVFTEIQPSCSGADACLPFLGLTDSGGVQQTASSGNMSFAPVSARNR